MALKSLLSFNYEPIHTETINKIEFDTQIQKSLDGRGRAQAVVKLISQKEILILADNCICRIGINSWKDIYVSMQESEGLQLLYFLILLKK